MTVLDATYYTTAADREQMITAIQVPLRNGDTMYVTNVMTLGDAIVASAIFLLLAFMVLKWLLDLAWRRRS